MKTIYFDCETYYDKDYSLRKMTPVEYVLDPRFELFGAAVAVDDEPAIWMDADLLILYLAGLPITEARVVSHNALFDMVVLALRYDLHPKLCVDTMSMSRALLSHVLPGGRVSLDNVAGYLKLGAKGKTLANRMGMSLAEVKARGLYQAEIDYACQDLNLCRGIYKHLAPSFPAQEFVINDMIIRMATRPQFQIDTNALYEHKAQIEADKASLLDRVGVGKYELMSNDKFALALERLGIDPPRKISPTTGKETFAFAKTDQGMTDLEECLDPDVQALVAARFGFKSTLEETRTQRFINISNVTWDGNASWMSIALRFSGAHTHRFSGDWKLNQQNLPSRKNTKLRDSLLAPPDHEVVTVDAAQIEARLNAWICGQWDLVAQFANGDDVYSLFASDIYGVVVTKNDKVMRLGGKISILGLGFQMGAPKFQNTWRIESAKADMPMELTLDEAERIVNIYRSKMAKIKNTWYWLQNMLPEIASGRADGTMFGPCTFEKQAILLPSGLRLYYNDLHYEDGSWIFTYKGKRKYLYGGKMLENIIQALDRICVMDAAVRIRLRCKENNIPLLDLAHQLHDELVYVPHKSNSAFVKQIAKEEMERRPLWGLDLPLKAEVNSGPNYGAAK